MFLLLPETTRYDHFCCWSLEVPSNWNSLSELLEKKLTCFGLISFHLILALIHPLQAPICSPPGYHLVNFHDKRRAAAQRASTDPCIGYPVKPCGDPLHALIMASPPVRRHGFWYNMYI